MQLQRISLSCLLALGVVSPLLAADKIHAETFARRSDYDSADLSPNGEFLSVRTPFEDRHGMSIIKLSGNYERTLIRFPDAKETVGTGAWSDDSRLLVMKAIDIGSLRQPLLNGDIYAVDADTGKQEQIFGYLKDTGNRRSRLKDEGNTSLLMLLPNSNGDALFTFRPWMQGNSDNITSVFRANTHTGTRRQIDTIKDRVSFAADNAGIPRLMYGWNLDGTPWVKYRAASVADSPWLPLPPALSKRSMWISHFEPDNNIVYAWINDRGEADELYRVDIAAGTRTKVSNTAGQDSAEILSAGYDGRPFAAIYNNGKPRIDYFDPKSEWAQLHAGLMKAFPGQLISFHGFSKDDKKVLFVAYSDRNPGTYYLFDRTTNKPSMLFSAREWIDPAKMASSRPIEFKNRNGDTLQGIYTAPLGKTGPQPLIVMAHGGPYGVQDEWGYDADTQFLANRGYAVLQVNYRGSGGRGDAFEESTYRQWGTGIQDDITDAVKWTIDQKLTDAARICTYGISFGGYTALMNPIRNPGMYKCAIGFAGVYDLPMLVKAEAGGSQQSVAANARSIGSDVKALADQSPVQRIADLNVPVLLIHGKSDSVVPFDQYQSMEFALKKAKKPFESLVKQNEGHGFYDTKNQTEVYERMEAFLLKYNPPN
jgi:dipeptidyl aminopeptidase/acylaminoacyl peptidase